MNTIYFVTSNKNKFLETKELLKEVINLEQIDLELLEIQSDHLEEIVKFKAKQAFKKINKPIVVED